MRRRERTMFGYFEMVAKRVDEQMQEFVKAQENVRQRTMSGLLDPFQILQPMRASVESATACELPPPKPPAQRRRQASRKTGKSRQPRARSQPVLHFA